MPSAIESAIRQICDEKGLAYESVLDAIESALAAAYRKDFGEKNQNIEVEFNSEDGSVKAFDVKTVVEDMDLEELERLEEERKARGEELARKLEEARERGEDVGAVTLEDDDGPRFNPKTDIMLTSAREVEPDAQLGDVVRQELSVPGEFGRMAAMTAKQVITQKLREAEREIIFNEFKEQEGQILSGTVQRREGRVVLVDLGRTAGILRPEDQIQTERYNSGDRLKVFVRQVSLTSKGAEILLSRTSEEMVRKLFEIEIPEITEGLIELKGIAREAGSRSKVAVWTGDDQIDPIGACIGQRGTRIQTIIAELGGEKVDIIEWDEDQAAFIVNSLSPAKIQSVDLNEETREAVVNVVADQLSLAIGRQGQNARLAARLTGWKINIAGEEDVVSEKDNEETDTKAPLSAEESEALEQSTENKPDQSEAVQEQEAQAVETKKENQEE